MANVSESHFLKTSYLNHCFRSFDQLILHLKPKISISSLKSKQDYLHALESDSGGREGCTFPIFCNHLFFCNHFKELQTLLFEVELIINDVPLTYVYTNIIETCLTPKHLLFGSQLSYSSDTKSTIVRNLTVFPSTTDKINRISNSFFG